MQTQTGIIIVDYKGEKDTVSCLDSLARITPKEKFQAYVVIVQNPYDRIAHHTLKPTIITLDHNPGFAGANNAGIERALDEGMEILILLNNDTTVDPKFLKPLVQRSQSGRVGMVSPKIYFSAGREFHHDEYADPERGKVIWYAGGVIDWHNVYAWHWGVNEVDHGQFEQAIETDFATGCCLAISAKTIEKIGLMDERYFLYLEDVDWSVKAKRAGLNVMVEPRSVIWHKNAGSTGGPGSTTQVYYQTRNRVLFARKYAPWKTKLAIYRNTFDKIRHGSEIEKKGAKDALANRWGKVDL